MAEVIVKVCIRKDKIKYLIIPKNSKINAGDYVLVSDNLSMLKKIKRGVEDGRRKGKRKI